MKRLIFYPMIFLAVSTMAQQECSNSILTIDFNTLKTDEGFDLFIMDDEDSCYFEHDIQYYLKIENINLNVFKVEPKVEFEKFNEEKPDQLKVFKLPSFLNLELPKEENGYSFDKIDKNYAKKLASIVEKLNSLGALQHAIEALRYDCSLTYDMTITKLKAAYALHIDTLCETSKFAESLERYIYEEIIPDLDSLYKGEQNFFDQLGYGIPTIENEIKKLEKKLKDKTDPKNINKDQLSLYSERTKLIEYKVYLDKAKKYIGTIKDKNLFEALYGLVNKAKSINRSSFTYIYPFKTKQDLTAIELIITALKVVTCEFPKKITLREKRWNKGGIKVDFSTGALINSGVGNPDFIGREYEYRNNGEGTSEIREKDFGSRALLSVGAFMHIYKRTNSKHAWALSPGLSTNEKLDGLLYHLGISYLYGKDSRFVLTLGTTLKSSEILDGNYSTGVSYETAELPENISTASIFPKFGMFFSLSYNLSKNE